MTHRSLDPARLLRALGLAVTRKSARSYRVIGGETPHLVHLGRSGWVCDYADSIYRRGEVCKHRLAVYMARQLTPAVREALQRLVEAA